MLTDQEKDRIKVEESYRFEVRQSLSNKEKKSGLWSYLNSPFTLWLLSTVAIGLISWGYQSYKTNLEIRHSQATKRSSLASEIGFRLQPIEPMRKFDEILIYLSQLDSSDVKRFAIKNIKIELSTPCYGS